MEWSDPEVRIKLNDDQFVPEKLLPANTHTSPATRRGKVLLKPHTILKPHTKLHRGYLDYVQWPRTNFGQHPRVSKSPTG